MLFFYIIIVIIAVIILYIWNYKLSNRINALEYKEHLRTKTLADIVKKTFNTVQKKVTSNSPEKVLDFSVPKQSVPSPPKSPPFQLEDFIGRKFFSILGILSIILAIGFFAMWAFSHGIIGPKGRIAIGILTSLVLLVAGELKRKQYPSMFSLFSSGGIAGLLITTFIARDFYDFITPGQSIFAYIVEVSVGITLALRYDSRVLGNFSIIGGILAPLLVKSLDPNAIGLLSFLAILSVAGFLVSTQKKWPEILWILFFGILGFEIGILNKNLLENSPFLFLGFIFGIHILLGSGGIVRYVREQESRPMSTDFSKSSISEILLFIISIFAATFLVSAIFEKNNWSHFGFFVLGEGFILFGLSEYLKSKNLEIFHKISIAATLLSIIFATIWEVGGNNAFILTIILIGEGVLFCFGGQKTQERIFEFIGRFTLLITSFWIFEINSFSENTICIIALIAGLLYSIGRPKKVWDKLWVGAVLLLSSIHIFVWNFGQWGDFLNSKIEYLLFLFPAIWSTGVAYSVIKSNSKFSIISGLILSLITNLFFWSEIIFKFSNDDKLLYVPIIALLLVLLGNFAVLSTCFIENKNLQTSVSFKKICTILILAFSTASIMFFGFEFLDEPTLSISWILWGSVLLGLGIRYTWPHFRYFGIGIFCFLIVKLYLHDVWEWEMWVRFFAFLALGISLLFTSFLYHKLIHRK